MRAINFYQAVYRIVAAIPPGKVTSYGAIAAWLGSPRAARAVGYALAADVGGDLPWHRVVNSRGAISEGGAPWRPTEQRHRLLGEAVKLNADDCADLGVYGFAPTSTQLRRWSELGKRVDKQKNGG